MWEGKGLFEILNSKAKLKTISEKFGTNPFDQPGVEAYKKNMFALLEKPGFEEATKEIKKRL